MEITRYNSDSGNRNLSTEKSFSPDLTFMEILQKANEIKAQLIVKTNYINEGRPGRWYLKGFNGKFSFEEIKNKIENNLREGKHSKRVCYLIKYY
tara:strand:- start:78 stop:362 length:285 start_codon:yes stop_codon:yes gene_type:complete